MTRWRTVAWVRPAIAAMTLLLVSAATWPVVSGQDRDAARRQRFTHNGFVEDEQRPETSSAPRGKDFDFLRPTEAPAGFDNLTNGFNPQGPPFDTIDEDTVVPLRSFNDNRFIFEEVETIADGLGPTYNAQSCRECHQNVVTGGASQVAEHRTGHLHGRRVLRVARRVARPLARDASRHRGARGVRGRHPHVPHLDQHAGRRLRRGDRQRHVAEIRTASRSRCAGTRRVVPVLEATGRHASAASAGRASTPASNRLRPMPT